ncbi:MAG: DUF1576 domain-containing protein [Oscillospiraceae bacterium]
MEKYIKNATDHRKILYFLSFTIIFFYLTAFALCPVQEIYVGMKNIIFSRDLLITDYFMLAGMGGAFFNAALVMSFTLATLLSLKLTFAGNTLATVMIMGGFALFGKNPVNIFPIILGTFIYAKFQKVSPSRYIYTAFLATGVAPIISELGFILPFSPPVNWLIAALCGMLIGFLIPSLSAHTASMHMGYNLFNVGFAVGILALCVVSVVRSLGFVSESVFIWKYGAPLWLCLWLAAYFACAIVYGLYLCDFKLSPALNILKHPGRAVADFVIMDGVGAAMVNMGGVGLMGLCYILIIGGDLSGPVVGALLTIFGFGAFGIHPKNYLPVMGGVYLSTFIKTFSPTTPSMQLAALFCGALAPISGQFGVVAGMVAGFLHASVVTNLGVVYSGLNLYNNGFSAGFVALVMLPVIESFIKRFKDK